MARATKDIEADIRALSLEDKVEVLRALIAELDGPSDPNVEKAWLETAQRRYRELVEGKVKGVPGPLVFSRLRSRLGG
ncbi:MAG TPA: addiction module protein [Steroidobacteraceae bacterium]|nr:addiction module protein [Steroidobacteraceae bacterium]